MDSVCSEEFLIGSGDLLTQTINPLIKDAASSGWWTSWQCGYNPILRDM